MTNVEVRDDPGHPEGGFVVIAFRGGSLNPGPARLHIETLTEGARYGGPRDLDVTGTARGDGAIVYSIGDGLMDTMPTGTGVQIEIAGTAIVVETVWPELTLRKAGGRRGGFRTRQSREVETPVDERPRLKRVLDGTAGTQEAKGSSNFARGVTAPGGTTGLPQGGGGDPLAADTIGLPTSYRGGGHLIPPVLATPQPTPWRARAAIAAVLGLGIGAVGGWGLSVALRPTLPPADPKPGSRQAVMVLPSLFVDLQALPTVSPHGRGVQGSDWRPFFQRATSEPDPAERAFWMKWAFRTMLKSDRADVAPMLTEYGRQIAEGAKGDPGVMSEAGLLWEMAALAGDCGAMTNLSRAFTSANWNDFADKCRGQRQQTR